MNHWKPWSTYKFQQVTDGKEQRRFQQKWLERFEWLVYSKEKDGGYCKYCVLFGPECAGKGFKVISVICKAMTDFQRAKYDVNVSCRN